MFLLNLLAIVLLFGLLFLFIGTVGYLLSTEYQQRLLEQDFRNFLDWLQFWRR